MHGWIGGACAEPTVIREARKVLSDGSGRLMYLGPAEELDGASRDGIVTVPIACASEGALEVYMEPVLPQPHVVVMGDSPAVGTLAGLLSVLDWRVTVIGGDDDSAVRLAGMEAEDVIAIVVASQGHYDESALEAALATGAAYIGLIASSRRAEAVLGYLRDKGLDESGLNRVRVPAGLDLGHVEHREIAVAILAELVQLRASGELAADVAVTEPAPSEAVDPVCGMTVEIATARWVSTHDDRTYYFCSAGCQTAFERAPASFLGV